MFKISLAPLLEIPKSATVYCNLCQLWGSTNNQFYVEWCHKCLDHVFIFLKLKLVNAVQ